MVVVLRCRDCEMVLRVDGRQGRDWPRCPSCGGSAWDIDTIASERIERAADDDAWRSSLDEYLTNDRRRV